MTEQAVSQTLTSASAGSIDLSAELLGDSSRAATLLTELRVIVSQDSQFLWRLTDSSPDGSEVSFCQERQDGYLFITKKYTSLGRAEFVAGLAKGEGNTIFVQDDDHHLSLLFNRIGSKYDHLVSLGATLGFDSACDWQELPIAQGLIHTAVLEYHLLSQWYRFVVEDAAIRLICLNSAGDVVESFTGDLADRLYQELLIWREVHAATKGEIEAKWRYSNFIDLGGPLRSFVECVLPGGIITVSRQIVDDEAALMPLGRSSGRSEEYAASEMLGEGRVFELSYNEWPTTARRRLSSVIIVEQDNSPVDGDRISNGYRSLVEWIGRNEDGLRNRNAVVNLHRQAQIERLISQLELGLRKFKGESVRRTSESSIEVAKRATGWKSEVDLRARSFKFSYSSAIGKIVLKVDEPQGLPPTVLLSVSPKPETGRYFEGFQQAEVDFSLVSDLFCELKRNFTQ